MYRSPHNLVCEPNINSDFLNYVQADVSSRALHSSNEQKKEGPFQLNLECCDDLGDGSLSKKW